MKPFKTHTGLVVPLDRANVDMDQIISKQYLKRTERTGYAPGLFYNWRHDYEDNLREDYVLNNPRYDNASILLAQENFGCGSSWEHATWALLDCGFKAVIAPSFGDFFYINGFNDGLVPICLDGDDVNQLFAWTKDSDLNLTVDMEHCLVKAEQHDWSRSFEVPEFRRNSMLEGIVERDQISETLAQKEQIAAYEAKMSSM